MTEKEKLKAALEVLQTWRVSDTTGRVFYDYLIDEFQSSCESAWKDRAERAEAALAESQERALRFEGLLKAEEARKDVEPVLDRNRAIETVRHIIAEKRNKVKSSDVERLHLSQMIDTFNAIATVEGWADFRSGGHCKAYQWK